MATEASKPFTTLQGTALVLLLAGIMAAMIILA